MLEADWHTYMILTKRPKRMRDYINKYEDWQSLENIWLGVSVENQRTADERIPILLQIPAKVRFVSCEPMLSEIKIHDALEIARLKSTGKFERSGWKPGLQLIIAGCESGPNARPMHINWVRSLRDQSVAAGVPFFLKQMEIDGKLVKMPKFDNRIWNQMPEMKHARD